MISAIAAAVFTQLSVNFIYAIETMPANRLLGSHVRAKGFSLGGKRCRLPPAPGAVRVVPQNAAVVAMQKQRADEGQEAAKAHVVGRPDRRARQVHQQCRHEGRTAAENGEGEVE